MKCSFQKTRKIEMSSDNFEKKFAIDILKLEFGNMNLKFKF